MSFQTLNLDSNLLRAIEVSGFTEPTDIQRQAIPEILAGKDLMASAQTGTGKTAAFVLPCLQRLLTPATQQGKGPRVLVLTPTRELAMQVSENIHQLSRFVRFSSGNVVGGMPYPPQMKLLQKPLDLLVATPGRLMDHMTSNRVDFSRLEVLILDEADRMLDMGFVDAVKLIAAATPGNRQTLLFSATLEGKVLSIAKQLLKDPVRIQLAVNSERHASIRQHVHQADNVTHKHNLLSHYLQSDELSQAVIFTATKRSADTLAKKLSELGHTTAALHGDMGQGARKRTVEQMRVGKYRLLVATDVAARGLDIKGISHVFNFDLPMVAEDYVHRIGRTGRGGATGTAISLVGPDDWGKLSGIERLTGQKLAREIVAGIEPKMPEPRGGSVGSGQRRPSKPFGANSARRSQGGGYAGAKQGPRDGYGKPQGNGNRSAKPAAAARGARGQTRAPSPSR